MKKKIRFHWFEDRKKKYKKLDCFSCEKTIEEYEGRYIDYLKIVYYCRNCANLIEEGYTHCLKKYKIDE